MTAVAEAHHALRATDEALAEARAEERQAIHAGDVHGVYRAHERQRIAQQHRTMVLADMLRCGVVLPGGAR